MEGQSAEDPDVTRYGAYENANLQHFQFMQFIQVEILINGQLRMFYIGFPRLRV